jgi:hypothetical protein
MAATTDLAKMVPGFEFLQSLMKNAGAAVPGMGQWIAPTLDPAELDKRIQELKTVQFWLEQNARLLSTTIQALEVQRMTLSTLQTMNLPMTELREALKIATPKPAAAAKESPTASAGAASAAAGAMVDPMKWWGALTQQFTELATRAVKDGAAEAARRAAAATAKPAPGAAAAAAAEPAATARTAAPRRAAARKRAA